VTYHMVPVVTGVTGSEIWRWTEVSQNGACGTSVFPMAII